LVADFTNPDFSKKHCNAPPKIPCRNTITYMHALVLKGGIHVLVDVLGHHVSKNLEGDEERRTDQLRSQIEASMHDERQAQTFTSTLRVVN
jgi:hypothetical protein